MNDKMKITIEIPNTGLEEDILRKGEWEDNSLFGISLRNALMHFTKDLSCINYVLDQIKAEIERVEINGYIRDVECFIAGLNTASKIIDKYRENED